jgi:hypothetical protein
MNTRKYNLEKEIKKQIDAREINPTRDLWAEIESQTSAPTSGKTKINWFLVAACLGLLLSLGLVLINNDEEVTPLPIAETTIKTEVIQPEKISERESTPILVEQDNALNKINSGTSPQQIKISDPEMVVVKNEIPSNKQIEIVPERTNNISNSIAINDSAKIRVKKKRFVDPSTLLFSVEHKDIIEKSKDGSNVATIELNSK